MEAKNFTRWHGALMPGALAFLAGVLVLILLPALPSVTIACVLCAMALLALLCSRFTAARLALWACGGFLLTWLHAHQWLQLRWPESAADERVRAVVVVESIPMARGADWLFEATVRIEAPTPQANALRVRLISRDPDVRPHAGERWRLLLALRPPSAHLNDGAVDGELQLFRDRIHAVGTVVRASSNQRLDAGHRPLTELRERIARHIDRRVADRDAAGLIAALAVGATGGMSREQWRVFNATGTTHLVAISGMHVTMFALLAFALARWLWRVAVCRYISWTRETFAAITGLAAATAYAFLAGLSVPTQRTLIMLAAWLLARSLARASPPLQPIAIAFLAVLLLDPFAVLSAGLWLSFAAMGTILFVVQSRIIPRGKMHEAVVVQLAVTASLAPLTLACFGSIAVLGPIVNAAAIPYISWLLVPTILLAVALTPLSSWLSNLALHLAEWLHNIAWPSLATAADSPWALAYASPPVWWYALATLAVIVVLMPWPWRVRVAAAICVLPLTAATDNTLAAGTAEFTALDVGEGRSVIVRTAHHALVYDTGEAYGTDGRNVENVLVPFLRSRGVHVVDTLMIGRLTPRTASGVTALLAAMPVNQSLIGGRATPDFDGARACTAGAMWQWDSVTFHVLDDCVLSVETPRGSVTVGDVAAMQFVDATGTRWAIAAGRSERNGKERPAVASWRQVGVHVVTTAEVGAVSVALDPGAGLPPPVALRSTRRAIWRVAPQK